MKKNILVTLVLILLASLLDFRHFSVASQKAANQPSYVVNALYNNALVPLDCWDSNHREKALPEKLEWPGHECRELSLLIVGSAPIKQINLIDKDGDFIQKMNPKRLKNGSYKLDIVMTQALAGAFVTKQNDSEFILTRDYFFEIISSEKNVSAHYLSVRYGFD